MFVVVISVTLIGVKYGFFSHFLFLLVFVAGRSHTGRWRHVRRIDCSRFAPGHDGVHENHLRAAPDPPERFQENLGRKYDRT